MNILKRIYTFGKLWPVRIAVAVIVGVGIFAYHRSLQPTVQTPDEIADSDAMAHAMADDHTTPPPATTASTPAAQPAQGVVPTSAGDSGVTSMHAAVDAPVARTQRTSTLTSDTYGNQVASFFPGEAPDAAAMDALGKINSSLSVDGVDTLGYPLYQLECEASGQCFNGTGTAFGSTADNAKQMFPVNPADIQKQGLKCNVICYNADGRIIGRDPNFHG